MTASNHIAIYLSIIPLISYLKWRPFKNRGAVFILSFFFPHQTHFTVYKLLQSLRNRGRGCNLFVFWGSTSTFLSVYERIPWDNATRTQAGFSFIFYPSPHSPWRRQLQHNVLVRETFVIVARFLQLFEKESGGWFSAQCYHRNNLPREDKRGDSLPFKVHQARAVVVITCVQTKHTN